MKLLGKVLVGVVAFRVLAPVVLQIGFAGLKALDARKGRVESGVGALTP